MEIQIVSQLNQGWKSAAAGGGKLQWTFAQTRLQFIKIEIKQSARISDNHNGLGLHLASSPCPKVFVIIERRSVANRSNIGFPSDARSNCHQDNDDSDAP